jgi:hypothetical protein
MKDLLKLQQKICNWLNGRKSLNFRKKLKQCITVEIAWPFAACLKKLKAYMEKCTWLRLGSNYTEGGNSGRSKRTFCFKFWL